MGRTQNSTGGADGFLIRRCQAFPTRPSTVLSLDAPPHGGPPLVDVRIAAGHIVEVSAPGLPALPGQPVIDAAGGALLPGLHDHHVHLMSQAAALRSVRVGPPSVVDRGGLGAALRAGRPPAGQGWVRAVGYHPSVAGELDRDALDDLCGDRPVRLQHRGGALWVLNSAAIARAGVADCPLPGVERDASGRPTGRLWRMDDWLRANPAIPPVTLDLAAVGRQAAARGVTGFTDATPGRGPAERTLLVEAARHGALPQRLVLMRPEPAPAPCEPSPPGPPVPPAHLGPPTRPGVVDGPVKIILDDDRLPELDGLTARIDAAHLAGHPVAVHCVTRVQTVLTLAALAAAVPVSGRSAAREPTTTVAGTSGRGGDDGGGGGDRIEHGAVLPSELYGELRERGLTVVTQPNFVAERGDRYLVDVDDEDPGSLYPAASLVRAGVRLAGGTDTPFGGADPWAAVRAAVRRSTAAGTLLGGDERLPAVTALALFLGHPDDPARLRTIRPGAPADLVLLRPGLTDVLADPRAGHVRCTFVAGVLVHPQDGQQGPAIRADGAGAGVGDMTDREAAGGDR
ncbi:amidohydrolase family protein [Frankia sp. AgPm24]|uniref:amidohydrolase family protein n=1 Tax=Frankia sp. AgPm24 TaxID=631128 RepID=UPI00200D3690|nr:amidohydrolase family protein [Frankia sp. AgPm24]MCK9923424.1 amidohydrolase family protein [Frankia sp. AgPm24]